MRNFVDRPARDTVSQLLRNFVSGKISNDAFEDAQPTTHDLAIDAIWHTAWVFYDDFNEHRLIGRHAYRQIREGLVCVGFCSCIATTYTNGRQFTFRAVCRQGFWDQWRSKLRESLAHLVGLIMRRAGGDASVALRVSFV